MYREIILNCQKVKSLGFKTYKDRTNLRIKTERLLLDICLFSIVICFAPILTHIIVIGLERQKSVKKKNCESETLDTIIFE